MSETSSRRAFTLIELMVVLGISAVLSALAITYSKIGQNEVALSVEESKVGQFILQAKQLAIATYTVPPSTAAASCGFGVTFNLAATPQTYSVFVYDPAEDIFRRDVGCSGDERCPPEIE
jgi:prepilin-type N-terminal cleavage/methylation domain-containing protein